MAAPLGNKNAKGHDGSGTGRKSAYEEYRDAQWQWKVWTQEQSLEEVVTKINTGKFTVQDMLLYQLLKGNVRLLSNFASKIMPDLSVTLGIDEQGKLKPVDYDKEAKARSKKYE